jgi:hypothetical protein
MTTIKPATTDEEGEHDAGTAFEGEIREFVRRDLAPWRRPRSEPIGEVPVESVNSLINRVAGQTVSEIDRVIGDLQNVRDLLRNEGDRVQREIVGYANLSQAVMASMKIIGESMVQWKTGTAPVSDESA